jgi:hypothetical protein
MTLFTEQEIRTAIRENKQLKELTKLFRNTMQQISELPGVCYCSGSHDNREWCAVCAKGREALDKLDKILESK